MLRDAVYAEVDREGFGRFHVNELGMSAFDQIVVVLVEPPDEDQRLLWRRWDENARLHDARLPAGTLQALGVEFIAAFEAELKRQ